MRKKVLECFIRNAKLTMEHKKFVRQRGEGCYNFRESCTSGQWKIIEANGERFIEMKFTNGQTWKLKVLYFDYENNLITDRQ
jgi:hypothetical protein